MLQDRKPTTVYLYGRLGRKFGKKFKLYVTSVAEAVRLLEANFPQQFIDQLRQGKYYVARGQKLRRGRGLTTDFDMKMGFGNEPIHICPASAGAGGSNSGGLMAVIGLVVVGAAILMTGGSLLAPFAALANMSGTTAGFVASIGLSMAVSGIFSLLTPAAQTDTPDPGNTKKSVTNAFSGPTTVSSQGVPVPVVYGRVRCSPVQVSAGIHIRSVKLDKKGVDLSHLSITELKKLIFENWY